MKTLAELQQEQARAMAALQRAHDIAQACPIPPHMVTSETSRAPWVSYRAETLREACDILRAFTLIPSEHWRAGCAMTCPESVMSERDRARYGESEHGPWACWIEVQAYAHGTTSELVFYAQVSTGPVRVAARFGKEYSTFHPLRPIRETQRDARTDRIIAQSFKPNAECYGAADKLISWGTGDIGPVKTSANHSYLFAAEGFDPMPGAECEHALSMLEILADRAGV